MSTPLEVLFEDNHCLVVNKPAPMLTQAPDGVPSLDALAKDYLRAKYEKSGNVYLGVPHRLDRPVSGVVVFARTSKAAARLAEQFRDRQVVKVYWGLVEGTPTPGEGEWRDSIRKVQDESRAEIVEAGADGAKSAVLRYRVFNCIDERRGSSAPETLGDRTFPTGMNPAARQSLSLVEFTPETGRMHQIRIQACQHGHPLLGDSLYGSKVAFGPLEESPRDRIIALHARRLTFLHPIRFEPIGVTAPLPAVWGGVDA